MLGALHPFFIIYNLVANDTTGKLFREDKHFSLSMNNELDLIFKSCSNRALFTKRSWWACSASLSLRLSRSTDSWIWPTSSTIRWWGGSRQSSTSGRWVRASKRDWATFNGFSLSLMAFFRCWMCFSWKANWHQVGKFLGFGHVSGFSGFWRAYLIIDFLHGLRQMRLEFVVSFSSLCNSLLQSSIASVPRTPHIIGALSYQIVNIRSQSLRRWTSTWKMQEKLCQNMFRLIAHYTTLFCQGALWGLVL